MSDQIQASVVDFENQNPFFPLEIWPFDIHLESEIG